MARHNPCRRCGGQLLGWNDAEMSCLQCGHIVYHYNPLLAQGRLDLDVDSEDETVPRPPDRGGQGTGEPK